MANRIIVVCLLQLCAFIAHAQTGKDLDFLTRIGAMNAVKKAHQMTDLPIVPVGKLYANKRKTYEPGNEYKGLIYSSVKELNTFVGQDVSIYTFMTALHNPRSVLYTERTDLPPYHGNNCMAYYGTVCSGIITYALGFKVTQRSADILVEDYFELIDNQSAEGVKLADLVCRKGHPGMVTGIERDNSGRVKRIEMSASHRKGCRRTYYNEKEFNDRLRKDSLQIYRYKYLYKNLSYTPYTEFVAVEGETLKPFKYNDVICTSKGDKSCYVTGEDVVLNVYGGGDKVEVFKNSKLFKVIKINPRDTNVVLKGYPYGDYQALVVKGKKRSDATKWKVIDVNVRIDKEKNRVFFSSRNSTPVYYEFCNVGGGRPANKKRVYAAEFTPVDLSCGYVTVTAPEPPTKKKRGPVFVKVHFECEYGMVINRPINWYENN